MEQDFDTSDGLEMIRSSGSSITSFCHFEIRAEFKILREKPITQASQKHS